MTIIEDGVFNNVTGWANEKQSITFEIRDCNTGESKIVETVEELQKEATRDVVEYLKLLKYSGAI